VKCTDCRGRGRFFRPEVIGDPGIACGTCAGSGRVAYDSIAEAPAGDGFVASRVTFYAALYPALREAAHGAGYALALHGSLAKDLDVVAVPWTTGAVPAEDLIRRLCEAAGGFAPSPPVDMPHGRKAWTVHLGTTGGYVDVSITPRTPEPPCPSP